MYITLSSLWKFRGKRLEHNIFMVFEVWLPVFLSFLPFLCTVWWPETRFNPFYHSYIAIFSLEVGRGRNIGIESDSQDKTQRLEAKILPPWALPCHWFWFISVHGPLEQVIHATGDPTSTVWYGLLLGPSSIFLAREEFTEPGPSRYAHPPSSIF